MYIYKHKHGSPFSDPGSRRRGGRYIHILCIHICIYMYMYICIFVKTYIYIHICMYVYVYISKHIYKHKHGSPFSCLGSGRRGGRSARAERPGYIYLYVYICMYIFIHIHIHNIYTVHPFLVQRSTGHTHTHTTAEQTTHTNRERATAQRRLIVEVDVAAPKLPPGPLLLQVLGAEESDLLVLSGQYIYLYIDR